MSIPFSNVASPVFFLSVMIRSSAGSPLRYTGYSNCCSLALVLITSVLGISAILSTSCFRVLILKESAMPASHPGFDILIFPFSAPLAAILIMPFSSILTSLSLYLTVASVRSIPSKIPLGCFLWITTLTLTAVPAFIVADEDESFSDGLTYITGSGNSTVSPSASSNSSVVLEVFAAVFLFTPLFKLTLMVFPDKLAS